MCPPCAAAGEQSASRQPPREQAWAADALPLRPLALPQALLRVLRGGQHVRRLSVQGLRE
eukprot:975951-Prymnesium_polylepis.1